MSQKIGQKELDLRKARERNAATAKPSPDDLAAKLPPSGKKPIKRTTTRKQKET